MGHTDLFHHPYRRHVRAQRAEPAVYTDPELPLVRRRRGGGEAALGIIAEVWMTENLYLGAVLDEQSYRTNATITFCLQSNTFWKRDLPCYSTLLKTEWPLGAIGLGSLCLSPPCLLSQLREDERRPLLASEKIQLRPVFLLCVY